MWIAFQVPVLAAQKSGSFNQLTQWPMNHSGLDLDQLYKSGSDPNMSAGFNNNMSAGFNNNMSAVFNNNTPMRSAPLPPGQQPMVMPQIVVSPIQSKNI